MLKPVNILQILTTINLWLLVQYAMSRHNAPIWLVLDTNQWYYAIIIRGQKEILTHRGFRMHILSAPSGMLYHWSHLNSLHSKEFEILFLSRAFKKEWEGHELEIYHGTKYYSFIELNKLHLFLSKYNFWHLIFLKEWNYSTFFIHLLTNEGIEEQNDLLTYNTQKLENSWCRTWEHQQASNREDCRTRLQEAMTLP